MTDLILIKLGGSVITNKEVPNSLQRDVLKRLAGEISRANKKMRDTKVILGHGQGSFAHAPAMRYRTMEGFVSADSKIGMAITLNSVNQLHRHVLEELINQEIPAVSWRVNNTVITQNSFAESFYLDNLLEILSKDLLPVTCGDVMIDSRQGCTIWSTETVFSFLVKELTKQKFSISRIINVGEVSGVLDSTGSVIPSITSKNASRVAKLINGTKGFDVTGGMWHKVQESLNLASELGISSAIISGSQPETLYNCLVGREFVGTLVE